MQVKKFPAKIINRKPIAENTVEVIFGFERDFDFVAGQYVRVILPKLFYEDEKNYRNFSVASSPNDKRMLTIAFRVSPSGFKKTLLDLPIGFIVEIEGPFGRFNLTEDASRPIVFIAGGIGITPFMSMLYFSAEQKLTHRIILLYVNQNSKSMAYFSKLENLQFKNKNFSLKPIFGLLDKDAIANNIQDIQGSVWYVSGPWPMVVAARKNLSGFGVSDKDIFFEEFEGYNLERNAGF